MAEHPGPPAPEVKPVQTPLSAVLPIAAGSHDRLRRLVEQRGRELTAAWDAMGNVHFARLLFLRGNTQLALVATFDGTAYDFVNGTVSDAGGFLNDMLAALRDAPPVPVEQNRAELLQYLLARDVAPALWYSAYPRLTVQQILKNASIQAAGDARPASAVSPPPPQQMIQLPLASIMNVNSPAASLQLRGLIQATLPKVLNALATVGTVHFGRFLFVEGDTQFAIVTAYDGPFDAYIKDFVRFLGPVFDGMLQLVEGGAPLIPVQSNPDAFVQYVDRTNAFPPALWYGAYPTLTVKNILAQAGA